MGRGEQSCFICRLSLDGARAAGGRYGDVFAPSLSAETLSALGSVANSIAVGIERKKGEEALLRQWHMFDTALSHTPDFAYTFDLDGRFTYVNRALLELWQKPLEEALGKNFFDLQYPAELAERLQRQIQQVIETKLPVRDGTPFTGANGTSGYFEYIFVPVCSADGRVEAVAGTTRDVSLTRGRSASQSEERLSFALVAGGGVGTWDWNVQEDLVYCDVRFAELFSMDPAVAAAGAPLSTFIAKLRGSRQGFRSNCGGYSIGRELFGRVSPAAAGSFDPMDLRARPMPSGWRGQTRSLSRSSVRYYRAQEN